MKITFVTPHVKIAGGVRAMLIYASGLADLGHEVNVLIPEISGIKRLLRNLFVLRPLWLNNFKAQLKWIPEYEVQYLPTADALVATAWQTAPLVAAAPDSAGRKYYLIQHYETLLQTQTEKAEATYKLPLKQIVISTWLSEIMRLKTGRIPELLVTPVDTNQFKYLPVFRQSKPIRVLILDHHAVWKGLAAAKIVIDRARALGADFKIVMFGVRQTEAATWADEYHLNPPQDKLAELYSSCHIYLCPSWYEGLGMPPMEAMACRVALATFDTGGSRDYAFDGQTALVTPSRDHLAVAQAKTVPATDIEALAHNLHKLVVDQELRENLAQAGQQFIVEHFSWPQSLKQFEKILSHA